MINEELGWAWCAGFFDGEGCISLSGSKLELIINQVDRRPLDKFALIVGVGNVSGPVSNQNQPTHSSYYKWRIAAKMDVQRILDRMWPYLNEPKKEKALEKGFVPNIVFS